MKLGVGTAQFGLDYGVSNAAGRVPSTEAREILLYAAAHGVNYIDTAASYGESESVLGSILAEPHPFRIVTKTIKIASGQVGPGEIGAVISGFHESLQRLNQSSVYGLLVHHPDDLLAENGSSLWEALQELRRDGLVSKLGVSVYGADQIDRVRDRCHLDIIQLPLNVLDQRLLASGHLDNLKSAGAEIHVRSIFLQGLLLMALDQLPPYFDRLRPKLLEYNQFLETNNLRPVQGALTFVSQLPQIDCAILGVCTKLQLIEILEGLPRDSRRLDFSPFALDDDPRINPANWRL